MVGRVVSGDPGLMRVRKSLLRFCAFPALCRPHHVVPCTIRRKLTFDGGCRLGLGKSPVKPHPSAHSSLQCIPPAALALARAQAQAQAQAQALIVFFHEHSRKS